MLDQNTDRMWYVIGALVVGAGIILLANKAMPEFFANVTSSFSEVVSGATSKVEILGRNNLINPSTLIQSRYVSESTGKVLGEGDTPGASGSGYYHVLTEFIPVTPGVTYRLTSNDGVWYTRYAFYDSNKEFIAGSGGKVNHKAEYADATAPSSAVYIRFSTDVEDIPNSASDRGDLDSLILYELGKE